MREITCTCPFTGLEFNAFQEESGDIFTTNPLTGETKSIMKSAIWANDNDFYMIPISMFKHVPIVKAYDAKEILGVSKQRIAQIIANDTIPVKRINGEPYFLKSDVLDYRENRAVGAPRKDK